jgi:Na+-transporting NADH:ubiquinone oxidoreductase subunit NqrE
MGVSRKLETAMGMGLATTFVLTLSSICAYLTDRLSADRRWGWSICAPSPSFW